MGLAGFPGIADRTASATQQNASTGERLWDTMLVAGLSTPITYALDGVQYVAAIAGRGGNQSTKLFAFKLNSSR